MSFPTDRDAVAIRAFGTEDHAAARALWDRVEGMGLNESDTAPAIAAYLARNPGFSAVAIGADGAMVGAVLAGHDGRRGSLHHLAVAPERRGQGIARQLLDHALGRLADAGIVKCNIFVFEDNREGLAFWHRGGWYDTPWKNLQIKLQRD